MLCAVWGCGLRIVNGASVEMGLGTGDCCIVASAGPTRENAPIFYGTLVSYQEEKEC